MKVKEAIEALKLINLTRVHPFYDWEEMKDVRDIAISALERQIPTRVTHEATLYKCCTCPNCKNVLDRFEKWGESTVRITVAYCVFCGQAIDWNEESEDTE